MTTELTDRQRHDATAYHRRRVVEHERHEHRDEYIRTLRSQVGLGAGGDLDDAFAQKLAEWQEAHPNSVARHRFDGMLRPRTEAHLGIQLEEMERLAQRMESYWEAGGIFYDSWGNDGRDNETSAPLVIDLPGPSRLQENVDLYRANGEHADGRPSGVRGDIVRERWPQFRLDTGQEHQFLIRLVCTLLHRRRRRPMLPRARPRG